MIKTIASSAFALLCVTGSAAASPLVLPGNTPVYFQFNNLEQVNGANNLVVPGYAPAVGTTQGNWGVFNVSSVQHGGVVSPHTDIGGGTPFFSDPGVGGGQLTGIFYGINLTS